MADEAILVINTISIVLFFGVLAGTLAERLRIPKMVPLILIGIVISFIGPSIIVDFEQAAIRDLTLIIAELGLFLVLYNEGMHISVKHLKQNFAPIIILASVGTILTVSIVGIIESAILGAIPGQTFSSVFLGSLLIAAIVVPTDPAATFSILRTSGQKVKKHLETIVGGESAFNDVIAILLVVIILIPQVQEGNTQLELDFAILLIALWQLIGGILLGIVISAATLVLIRRVQRDRDRANETAALSLTSVFLIFSLSQLIDVSGAIACLAAGVIMSNPHYVRMKRWYTSSFMEPFWSKIVFLIEIFAFTFVGMLFDLESFGRFFVPGLVLSLIVLGVRIVSVYISTSPLERHERTKDIITNKDKFFIAFAGLKGLTTAVLALLSFVALEGSESKQSLFDFADALLYTALTLILVSGIIQGLLLPGLSTRLEVYEHEPGTPLIPDARPSKSS